MTVLKKIKRLAFILLLTYLLIEITGFFLIQSTFISAPLPGLFQNPKDTTIFPFTYADVHPDWGVWHIDHPVKMPYGCLTIECTPNSYGARDKERQKQSADTNRCIVLGDSFLEGFGISTNNRLSDLLENATQKEFLNFACADMGSTQEYLVYKKLASGFEHNTLLIGILPANDFLNDDIAFDSIQTPKRYKPYWEGKFPDMNIYYHVDDLHHSQFTYEAYRVYKASARYRIRHFLENTTCWFNIVYHISQRKKAKEFITGKPGNDAPYSGYYHYSEEELSRLQQSLLSIRNISTGKRMIVFTIPVATDFARYRKDRTTPPLTDQLNTFCAANGIIYTDLLSTSSDEELSEYAAQFFNCDIHWNETGNEKAFNKLLPLFRN